MIGIVIVAHGGLAREYLAAVEHVVGPQSGIRAITMEDNHDRRDKQDEICEAANAVDVGDGVVLVTDLFGIVLILPFTRPLARRALTGLVTRKLVGVSAAAYMPGGGIGGVHGGPGNQQRPHPNPGGSVVEGEVVD